MRQKALTKRDCGFRWAARAWVLLGCSGLLSLGWLLGLVALGGFWKAIGQNRQQPDAPLTPSRPTQKIFARFAGRPFSVSEKKKVGKTFLGDEGGFILLDPLAATIRKRLNATGGFRLLPLTLVVFTPNFQGLDSRIPIAENHQWDLGRKRLLGFQDLNPRGDQFLVGPSRCGGKWFKNLLFLYRKPVFFPRPPKN